MPVADVLLQFRKSIWFRVLYVAVLAFLVSVLLLIPPLSALLVPATMAVIPYYLRERGYRKYIVNGMIILAAAILIVATISAFEAAGQTSVPPLAGSAPGVDLTNGTVEPFRGTAGQAFLFSVDIRTAQPVAPSNVDVWLNLSYIVLSGAGATVTPAPELSPVNPSDQNFTDGVRYSVSVVAPEDAVYFFAFSALVNATGSPVFLQTTGATGPQVLGFGGYFVVLAIVVTTNLAVYPAVFYFLGLGVYWLYKRGQRRRAAAPRPAAGPPAPETAGGTFTCTNCGATVSDQDETCPSCGAVFEPEPELPNVERIPPKSEGRDGEP